MRSNIRINALSLRYYRTMIDLAAVSNRQKAAHLFWRGYTVTEISAQMSIAYATVDSWKRRDNWEQASVAKKIEAHAEIRLATLIAKTEKSQRDFNEMEQLGKLIERTARINKFSMGGNETDLNPKIANRNKQRHKKQAVEKKNNYLTKEDIEKLEKKFKELLYTHQKKWYRHSKKYNIRNYLKSRQVGATLYFSWEAVLKAAISGRNQIFLSASKAQAHVFKRNIINFVREATGKELKADPIVLPHNGAELHFLGTNKNTAQSYSGDLYIDEYFWIGKFKDIEHVASGMAVLDDRCITYFSTPSTINHEAYPLWTGEHYNRDRPRDQHIEIDTSHKSLKDGRLCEDGIFRQMVTIDDAVESGYDLVTIKKLKQKFPPSKYANLFLCEFISDLDSVFKLSELQRCMVDSWSKWSDFNPMDARPYGDNPVWIGYDPSRKSDDSSLVVIAPPKVAGGKFRVLESFSWHDMDFDKQAKKIKALLNCYNVQNIAIDATGIGNGVYELVKKFFPSVHKIVYNVEVKNAMVLKAKQLISHGRLEFDNGMFDIAHAFMTIHQDTTGTGRQVTYRASRTATTGHADLAWAVMHAISKEPIQSIDSVGETQNHGFMEIY